MKAQTGFQVPLKTIVHKNFNDVMKRIKAVKFLPDRIHIVLLPVRDWAARHAIRISVLMLEARILSYENGRAKATSILNLTDLNLEKFIYYDEVNHILSIPIPNSFALHFIDDQKVKIFSQK